MEIPTYYISSPMALEEDFNLKGAKPEELNYIFEPKTKIEPCSRLDIPNFHGTHEIDIFWPFVLCVNKNDLRVKYACRQIVIISPPPNENLKGFLFDIIYLCYYSYRLMFDEFARKNKSDISIPEFEETLKHFDLEDMAIKIRSRSQ